jgi:CheY-like chemotaxis protein
MREESGTLSSHRWSGSAAVSTTGGLQTLGTTCSSEPSDEPISERDGNEVEPQPSGGVPPVATNRILVVDDDEPTAEVLGILLSGEGYEVRVAPEGRAALGLLPQLHPDLILLDARMPGMDGAEFIAAYRRTPGPHALVVVLSAMSGGDEYAAQIGADAFLPKPFDVDELLSLLVRLLGGPFAD